MPKSNDNVPDVTSPVIPEEYVTLDSYNGVLVDLRKVPIGRLLAEAVESEEKQSLARMFMKGFQVMLDGWEDEGKRGIWLTLSKEQSLLVPLLADLEFDFQFCEKGKVVMTRWLPSTESRLPLGPSHQVGIGALVLHPITKKMLVVQEKSGPAAKRKLWKMPTGLTDPGEDIAEAAVREMKEETGLDCDFDHVICFRQAHGGLFNKSDMFFVCMMRLLPKYHKQLELGNEIEFTPQESEIAEIKWVEISDYINQQTWVDSPLYSTMNNAMLNASLNFDNDGPTHKIVGEKLEVGFRPGHNTLYTSLTNPSKL